MKFFIRLKPIFAPVRRRIDSARAPDVEILQPEETEAVRPPALLPGMLERATATDEHSELSQHLTAARATVVTHTPVVRYTYRKALIRRSGFATRRHGEHYGSSPWAREPVGPTVHLPLVRYCHNIFSWRYFGHWLSDAIPSAVIDPERGALWMPPNPDWVHARGYIDALDLAIIGAAEVCADELIVYRDFCQGSHKQIRYSLIREKIRLKFASDISDECVFISRGPSGAKRNISNESALIEALILRNWRVIDSDKSSIKELQAALCNARVVVSIDGSHLDHAQLSCKSGAIIICLIPHDRFTMIHLNRCRAHGVRPGFVVLTGTIHDGYYVELDEVLRTIDLADALA
jgi:hypothetical protein